jgi:hypothetical protein
MPVLLERKEISLAYLSVMSRDERERESESEERVLQRQQSAYSFKTLQCVQLKHEYCNISLFKLAI